MTNSYDLLLLSSPRALSLYRMSSWRRSRPLTWRRRRCASRPWRCRRRPARSRLWRATRTRRTTTWTSEPRPRPFLRPLPDCAPTPPAPPPATSVWPPPPFCFGPATRPRDGIRSRGGLDPCVGVAGRPVYTCSGEGLSSSRSARPGAFCAK